MIRRGRSSLNYKSISDEIIKIFPKYSSSNLENMFKKRQIIFSKIELRAILSKILETFNYFFPKDKFNHEEDTRTMKILFIQILEKAAENNPIDIYEAKSNVSSSLNKKRTFQKLNNTNESDSSISQNLDEEEEEEDGSEKNSEKNTTGGGKFSRKTSDSSTDSEHDTDSSNQSPRINEERSADWTTNQIARSIVSQNTPPPPPSQPLTSCNKQTYFELASPEFTGFSNVNPDTFLLFSEDSPFNEMDENIPDSADIVINNNTSNAPPSVPSLSLPLPQTLALTISIQDTHLKVNSPTSIQQHTNHNYDNSSINYNQSDFNSTNIIDMTNKLNSQFTTYTDIEINEVVDELNDDTIDLLQTLLDSPRSIQGDDNNDHQFLYNTSQNQKLPPVNSDHRKISICFKVRKSLDTWDW